MTRINSWTEREDEILRRAWADPDMTVGDVACRLGRTYPATLTRARKGLNLGPKASHEVTWTDARSEQLRELWADRTLTAAEIGRRIGATKNAVLGQAHRMGLPSKIAGRIPKERPQQEPLPWTEERVAELRRLWAEGRSATEIAKSLGGITRARVTGKAHRLGLRKDEATTRLNVRRLTPKAVPSPKFAPDAELPPPDIWAPLPGREPVPLLKASHFHCRWPVELLGEAQPHVCGAAAVKGSWCATHSKIGHQPARVKKRVDERLGVRRWREAA